MKLQRLLLGLCAAALCTAAHAQTTLDHPVGRMLPYVYDTGFADNPINKIDLVDAFEIRMNNAAWLRVYFDVVSLPEGGFVQITSLKDGETQRLDAAAIDMWSYGSAYFNGDAVVVEVFAGPGTRATRIGIKEIAAEFHAQPVGDPGICGICGTDDRFQTNERWSGRIMPVGCTGSMYCSGDGMITAGHCVENRTGLVIQFNVPNSAANCATVAPPVDDQFPVLQNWLFQNAGEGADWAACRVGTNGLGQTPVQRYGVFRPIAPGPSGVGAPTNMWGYGLDTNCPRSQTQQNSAGAITQLVGTTHYWFNNDVRGGNSGSGYLNANNQIIGVVSHCRVNCPNTATRIDLPAFVAARNSVGCAALPPINDNCGSATTIGLGTVTGSTSSATNDGVGSCRPTSLSPDVWFAFTPTCGGTYRFTTCDAFTNYDTVLSIHDACPGNADNTLFCNDDAACSFSSLRSTIDAQLVAGERYLVRIGGFGNASGNFALTTSVVTLNAAPANDNCASAQTITPGVNIVGSTFCATVDGSATCGLSTQSPDVWYSFTPTCSGTYTFATCEAASYDTVLSLHSGCPGTTTNQIACNDDACPGLRSSITAVLTAGTNYRLRVSGYNGRQGTFTIALIRGADTFPANDECAAGPAIGLGTTNGSTLCATIDGGASCGLTSNSQDVWYTFTPDCSGFYEFNTFGAGTNYDTVLSMHTGCPGTSANQIACNDDFGSLQSRIVVSLTAGTAYRLRVGGFSTSRGNFQLNVNNLPNDLCANPVQVFDGANPFSNRGANTDGTPAGICTDVAGNQQVNQDVWFFYSATCDGTVDVNTCAPGYDTKLAVYEYIDTTCPATDPIGCNDDSSCSFSSLRSRVTFQGIAGRFYIIRVGGYSVANGCGTLNISCTPDSTCSPCAADYNQDGGVDGADVDAFFSDWEQGLTCADVNEDGGIDGADVDFFFNVWEDGGC
jgi:hypothetical protein